MKVNQFIVNINTNQLERMVAFYRDVVGLTPSKDFPGAFMAGSADFPALIIETHSEVTGPTKEPARAILNFFVDDLEAEQRRLKAENVTFLIERAEEPGFGFISTFLDPDGNFCQLIELHLES